MSTVETATATKPAASDWDRLYREREELAQVVRAVRDDGYRGTTRQTWGLVEAVLEKVGR